MKRFLDQVPAEITDPIERQRRALLLQKAHMQAIAIKSAATRRRRRPETRARAGCASSGELMIPPARSHQLGSASTTT
jgi:hypothetical protein